MDDFDKQADVCAEMQTDPSLDDASVRLQCLAHALSHSRSTSEEVVAIAERFYAFVSGNSK